MTKRLRQYYRKRFSAVSYYMSTILMIGGCLLFIPFLIGLFYGELGNVKQLFMAFILPGIASILIGVILKFTSTWRKLYLKDSMFICALAWITLTLLGAIPFVIILDMTYLNACFETMSGFTTTGITVLKGLDDMPRSILFWRSFTQWIGGLGILSMFILIGFKGGAAANKLFMAEGHKISAKKPAPGMFTTAKVLWTLYITFTIAQTILLIILGLDFFDAITHSFTTLSTGGYSIHDASIGYFQQAGYQHYHLIEIVVMIFMLFGGINFFIHYRFWKGDIKSFWDNTEMKYFWGILFGTVILIFLSSSYVGLIDWRNTGKVLIDIKHIIFQIISIFTTTGYATKDINSAYFTAFAKQIFLVLMVIGGCAGSTGGGIKVIRVAILSKLVKLKIIKLNSSRLSRVPLTVDNQRVEDSEVKRIITIFFVWILLLIIGGGITAFFSKLGPLESFSGMFSALGNIGPCYITVGEMMKLHPVIKITYIIGMLAGRLEILPVLIIFNRKFFK